MAVFDQLQYQFLKKDPRLQSHIILLGVSGSRGYGTGTLKSDWDLRGCAMNSTEEILCNDGWNTIEEKNTDTCIYSFPRLCTLLEKNNPNTLELLGLRQKDYIYISQIGQELLGHADLFFSQEAFYTFGGYAQAQLKRLENKVIRDEDQKLQEQHILKSIQAAERAFKEKYAEYSEDDLKLYISRSEQTDKDDEIYMDVNLTHYPLRDYKCLWSEMNNIVKEYGQLGQRNKSAIAHDKLGKHMMHLVRLYLTGTDLLETGQMHTYREKDLDLLMDIRNGKYLNDHDDPKPEFFDMVDELENKMQKAKEHTYLPKNPDHEKIRKWMAGIQYEAISPSFKDPSNPSLSMIQVDDLCRETGVNSAAHSAAHSDPNLISEADGPDPF